MFRVFEDDRGSKHLTTLEESLVLKELLNNKYPELSNYEAPIYSKKKSGVVTAP